MKAPIHPQEARRVAALRSYDILDTPRESDFDDIVALCSRLCDAPISLINLIDTDRQWFKAEVGFGAQTSPLETSLCTHANLMDEFVEIPDTLADARMADNPMCLLDPGIRFYAGAQLRTDDGFSLGMLCVLDTRPRTLTPVQIDTLRLLANQVMKMLELRRAMRELQNMRREADHRIKNSFQSVAALIRIQARASALPETRQALEAAQSRITTYATLHDLLARASAGDQVELDAYLQEVCDLLRGTLPPGIVLTANLDPALAPPNRAAALATILNEWCTNSAKHAFPNGNPGRITVRGQLSDDRYTLTCTDDGTGSPTPPAAPAGIGSTLVRASATQLQTIPRRIDLPTGTGWEIDVPLSQS